MNAVIDSIKSVFVPSHRQLFGNALRDEEHEPGFFDSIIDVADEAPVIVKEKAMAHEVMSVDDLPVVGDPEVTYKVTSTLDLYRWVGGEYVVHNPYLDPVVKSEGQRKVLVDPTATLPHLTEDHLKRGGDIRLAMVYNVHALREDLRRMEELDISMKSLLPKNLTIRDTDIPSMFLQSNHVMLTRQLRTVMRGKGNYDKYVIEGMARMGVDVWYDEVKRKVGFKDGSFVALV